MTFPTLVHLMPAATPEQHVGISSGGSRWSPWATYNDGLHHRWMSSAEPHVVVVAHHLHHLHQEVALAACIMAVAEHAPANAL